MAGGKHYSGQTCTEAGTYGQYSDADDSYAGSSYDRTLQYGDKFPPSKNNHYFKKK
jgi:hypothetical protein